VINIEEEVKSAIPEVMNRMRQNIIDKITREAEVVALEAIRNAVREWVKEELIPEVRAQLDAGKAGLIAQSATIADSLSKAIGEALVENARKSLATGYTVKDIAERLFRGY
jgi:vacuolar-type H+-ATPase subunit E/Vma4